MSYNIISTKTKHCSLELTGRNARIFLADHGAELPESNPLEDLDVLRAGDEDIFEMDDIRWSGEFSGRSYNLLSTLLGLTKGSAEFYVVWEEGQRSYFKVNGGEVSIEEEPD